MRCLFLIGLFVISRAGSLPAQLTFQKQLDSLSGLFCLEQTADGNFWLGTFLGKIIRLDPTGQFLNAWNIHLGDTTTSRFVYDLEAAPGGGAWALYDRVNFNNALDDHLILARLATDGKPLWQTNVYYGEVQHWAHNRMTADPAGNVFISSARNSPIGPATNQPNRIILSKVDPSGALLWTKAYRNAGNNYTRAIRCLADGSLLVCGNSQIGTSSGFLLRLSPDGDVLWSRRYNRLLFKAFAEMPDGSWVFAATETGLLPQAACVLRLDQQGNVVWARRLIMPYALNWSPDLARAFDGNILVFNYETPVDTPVADLICLSANGGLEWARRYDVCRNHGITAGLATSDGGIAGIRFRAGGHLFLKTDAAGHCASCPAQEVALTLESLNDSPMPASWEVSDWPMPPAATAGFFPFQAPVQDFCGQEKPVTGIQPDADTVCLFQSLNVTATGPGLADSYRWTFEGGTPAQVNGSASVNGIQGHTPGLMFILLEAVTGFCRDSFFDTVLIRPGPAPVDLGPDTTLCGLSSQIKLDATTPGATTYTWTDGVNGPYHPANASGTYAVQAAGSGCTVADTIRLEILENLLVSLGSDTTLCAADSFWLDATSLGAERYRWDDGSESPRRLIRVSGFYAVTAFRSPCAGSDFISVDLFPRPPALPPDTVLCADEPLVLTVGGSLGGAIFWNGQPGLGAFSFDSSGIVRRTVEYRHCRFDDSIAVFRTICRDGFALYAPNVFSPDADGRNDFFELSGPGLEVLDLQVFDRWGNHVFQQKSTGLTNWDGTVRGTAGTTGVYVWIARLRQHGREGWQSGDVLLINRH